jgi:hypothetical protein
VTYVSGIEPRLTPVRDVRPATAWQALADWTVDLKEEVTARCALVSPAEAAWQPHPDANSAGVTVWHIARWLDVLANRVLDPGPSSAEAWHRNGWAGDTGYDPAGVGFLGMGTLTGYTPEQMRAVPTMAPDALAVYTAQAADELVAALLSLGDAALDGPRIAGSTPYQLVGSTVQGSFGHVGEIDALVALYGRLAA